MLVSITLGSGGCASVLPDPGERAVTRVEVAPGEAYTRAEARGNWDDGVAAVWLAAEYSEMAVEAIDPGPSEAPGLTRVTLRRVTDQTVRLVLAAPEGTDAARLRDPEAEVEIRVSARIGDWGDPEGEARLVRHVADRIEALRGVGHRAR